MFNDIWQKGTFPEIWKEATIIPIPKPGKDHSNPQNYRPIALTSCLCKTLERMINDRLVWFLESNNLLTNIQSGFRHNRTTTDHLIKLENFIREGFIRNEHVVAIFFDLEKAYDTTWKHGILKDLHKMGLRGRLLHFISNFLQNRKFKVRIGNTLSEMFTQEEGVPQGSILSVTLFIIKINSLAECIKKGIDSSLFVDDFGLCYRGQNMDVIERQLQQCINKVQDWADDNGFKFSKTKTVCVHFCNKRKLHPDPVLKLNDTVIPVVKEAKYLGLIFDHKLSFIPHIKYLKTKCQKALNLLKVISNTSWGADRKTKLLIYRALIRSKLDYGSMVFGSARQSYLSMLDPIQNQALRLCLGAFRTSPVESLRVEGNEMSLYKRRIKLSMQYTVKLYTNKHNPTHKIVFSPQYRNLFDNKPNAIKPFGLRMEKHLHDADIRLEYIADYSIPNTPPWRLQTPSILLHINKDKTKQDTSVDEYKTEFNEVRSFFKEYEDIYTDGSKDNEKVAAAAVTKSHIFGKRLPKYASIFTAELRAIHLAFMYIKISRHKKFILFSDSKSVLEALANRKFDNPIVLRLVEFYNELQSLGKDIILCWIPSHIGIPGNAKADKAAKQALNKQISESFIPFTDFKPNINQYIYQEWQNEWNNQIHNKLHEIQSEVGKTPPYMSNRKHDSIIRRLRIGHTYITHGYLLRGELAPECIPCNEPLTMKHILLDCTDFANIRTNFFNVNNLKDLFEKVTSENIINYLKAINLVNKI